MKFQEFWEQLSIDIRRGKKLATLEQKKEFEAIMNGRSAVRITPSTEKIRIVLNREFEAMWDKMKDDIRSERYINKNGRYHDYLNSSYVSALIDSIVQNDNMQ